MLKVRPVWLVAGLGFGYLLFAWAAVLAVDFLNLGNAQVWWTADLEPLPVLWFELFAEGKPAENLQWAFLATGFLAFVTVALKLRTVDRVRYRYALMLSIGLLLMLIEDSLNFRHVVVDTYFPLLFGDADDYPRRTYRLIWELTFYSMLSVLMVLPLFAFWRRGIWRGTGLRVLIAGYLVYGAVGFGSAMRRVGDWQERLGHWIIERFDLAALPAWQESLARMAFWHENVPDYPHTLGYLLTDHLIEESVELLAATLLVMGLLMLRRRTLTLESNVEDLPSEDPAKNERPTRLAVLS